MSRLTVRSAVGSAMFTAVDAAVVVGLLAVALFPVFARLAADRLPVEPGPRAPLAPLPAGGAGGMPRDLPAGRSGEVVTATSELTEDAVALLGPRAGPRLVELAGRPQGMVAERAIGGSLGFAPYPYRYADLEPLLPERFSGEEAERATDLAGRLLGIAARSEGYGLVLFRNAGPVAYALLDRARAAGGCEPQLDLLLVVAADTQPRDDVVAEEAAMAERACPADVTPGWLLGQFQSQRALLASTPVLESDVVDEERLVPRPFETFTELQRRFPRSPAGWSGEADANLRLAYQLGADEPFRARQLYEAALVRYRRAARLQPDPGLDAGMARALAGLGRADEAVAAQERAIGEGPSVAALTAPLVEYLESARRFDDAAATAERLQDLPLEPASAEAFYPYVTPGMSTHPLNVQDAVGPLSLGDGRLTPLTVALQPGPGGADASVLDFSFIPRFRPHTGVTGSHRWCPEWTIRRDAILAGRPGDAIGPVPDRYADLREPYAFSSCSPDEDPELLVGLAQLELGDVEAAREHGRLADLHYARQNLWRWAGDLERAERAAREWVEGPARNAGARLALGEVQFLRRDYEAAADTFAVGTRLARDDVGFWSFQEAEAQLKHGAALAASGRRGDALAAFAAADETASRALGIQNSRPFGEGVDQAQLAWLSYHARAQAGDAHRENGDLDAAADAYAAARERQPLLAREHAPFRSAHVDNNAALVAIAQGRPDEALLLAGRASAGDPANPAFLMTQGFAALRAGDTAEAIRLDRAALAADPSTYPAANDLGVLLGRAGRDREATDALRRAVGANPEYALGWFNLGVVLGDRGPLHILGSQGALARAYALDPDLRDRKLVLTVDERTYRTGLDLSKPLPPGWSFAGSQEDAPARTAGLVAILLLAVGLTRLLTSSGSGRAAAERWLQPIAETVGRLGAFRRPWPVAVAVAATVVVFLWPRLLSGGGGFAAAVLLALGVLLLVALALRARALVARRRAVAAAESGWGPGVVFGLGASAVGVPWAPVPVVRSTPERLALHWAGPVALAVAGLALTALAVWLDVPLTRALAAAALVMAASMLTPVRPLDGASVSAAGVGGTLAAAAGIGVLLLTGVL